MLKEVGNGLPELPYNDGMSLVLAVLCEEGKIDKGGLNLTRVFRTISCSSFPYTHPKMCLACSVAIPTVNKLDRVHFWAELVNPDGKLVARVMSYASRLAFVWEKGVRGIRNNGGRKGPREHAWRVPQWEMFEFSPQKP